MVMAEISKLNFINKEILLTVSAIDKGVRAMLIKRKIGASQDLINSIGFKVFKASAGDQGKMVMSFVGYGRLRDMGVSKGLKIESIKGNTQLLSGGKRKSGKWYSKVAYKAIYGGLIAGLVSNYVDSTIKQTKTDLQRVN